MAGKAIPVILTIAGFDPSSGAGVTADLKTIAAHDCYGMAALTALTVQNTQGVYRIEPVDRAFLRETLQKLSEDVEFAAIKVGMLGTWAIAELVCSFLQKKAPTPIVLDPIISSSSGSKLIDQTGVDVLRMRLLPLSSVITPNLPEAETLVGFPVKNLADMSAAAKKLQEMGARDVVITGGHRAENVDLVRLISSEEFQITGPIIESASTHGTGCAYSTAVACRLALGDDLRTAATHAKEFVRQAIAAAYPIGKGKGPLNHLFKMEP